jgi:hypothetical protein
LELIDIFIEVENESWLLSIGVVKNQSQSGAVSDSEELAILFNVNVCKSSRERTIEDINGVWEVESSLGGNHQKKEKN